jgi:hypothetical protein
MPKQLLGLWKPNRNETREQFKSRVIEDLRRKGILKQVDQATQTRGSGTSS